MGAMGQKIQQASIIKILGTQMVTNLYADMTDALGA